MSLPLYAMRDLRTATSGTLGPYWSLESASPWSDEEDSAACQTSHHPAVTLNDAGLRAPPLMQSGS